MNTIKVNVRLFGTLRGGVPHYDPSKGVEVELNEGDTLRNLVDAISLEDKFIVLMVKGSARTLTYRLNDLDEVSIFLPVSGG